jgi:beta-lactamase superfamily II metal-dependent hydrolase
MAKRIVHFNVGNGNCCVVEAEDFVMAIDLKNTDEKTSYEIVSPFFRDYNGKKCLDVLVITHGDKDHCEGYCKFQDEIDEGKLTIGKIIHQDYDRVKSESDPEWSKDYEILQKEINARSKKNESKFGELVAKPKNGDKVATVLEGVTYPSDLEFDVISPFEGDDENSDYDVNDLSLVFRLNLKDLGGMLFTGDSSSKYWQDKIVPSLDKEQGKAKYLVTAHHGSYSFFGKTRDEVRDADPEPDNYEALSKINPEELIISAASKFPTNGDSNGDQPPHYAAYKWYHKWFRDNRGVKPQKDEPHPNKWYYTSEGNICLEWENDKWAIDTDWSLKAKKHNQSRKEALTEIAVKADKPWRNG